MIPNLPFLLNYDRETNRRYIEIILDHKDLPGRVRQLMGHILNAQEIWLSRIEGKKTEQTVWQIHEDRALLPLQEALSRKFTSILDKHKPDEWVTYQNSKGLTFQNRISDIMFHLINHGTHHRAQIAAILSQRKVPVPSNDFIFWRREVL